MWRLAVATLRFRMAGLVAAFIAMALGAAIVLACGGLMESGIRAAVPPQRLAAAAVVVAGDQSYQLPGGNAGDEEDAESATLVERVRVDAGLVSTIQRVPGVADAVGTTSFAAIVLSHGQPATGGVQVQGANWASATLGAYSLRFGAPPARPGEVVLDTALAQRSATTVGSRIRVAAGGTTRTYRVAGIAGVAGRTGAPATTQATMFFSASDAGWLAGHRGWVDAIGVLAEPGTDIGQLRGRIQAAVTGHPVVTLTGDDRGLAEFPEAKASSETLIAVAAVFGGIAVMVAIFVVASTRCWRPWRSGRCSYGTVSPRPGASARAAGGGRC
jgi:putative ABC transport system permease protein